MRLTGLLTKVCPLLAVSYPCLIRLTSYQALTVCKRRSWTWKRARGVSTLKGKSARSHVGSSYRSFMYHGTLAIIVHAPLSSLDARLAIFICGLYQAYTRLTSDNTTNADSSEVEFIQSFITVQVRISISSFTLRGLHCVLPHPSPLQ